MRSIAIAALLALTFAIPVHAEKALDMEDEALEAALRQALGKPEGPIDGDDLASLTALDLPRRGIISLAGLERCVNLERLDLSMNRVEDIAPLARLVGLRQLTLQRNRIADLSPLAGLAQLTELDVSANRVVSLAPLAGLATLERLALRDNRVRDLTPLASLSRLSQLGLSRNPIRDASPLSGLEAVTHLGLAQTLVTDAFFAQSMGALRQLTLRDCPLSQKAYCETIPALRAAGVNVDAAEGCGNDADGDDLTDAYEAMVKTRTDLADTDEDGLRDSVEVVLGTDPLRADSDEDGMPDAWEHRHGLDPRTADGDGDLDGDGHTNGIEYAYETAPNDQQDHPEPASLLVDTEAATLSPRTPFALFNIQQTGDIPLRWKVESSDYRIWVTDPPGENPAQPVPAGAATTTGFNPALYERVDHGTGPRELAIRTDSFPDTVDCVVTITNVDNTSQKATIAVHREAETGTGSAEQDTFALTVLAMPESGGKVFLEPSGGRYAPGTEVTLGAVPAEGYVFDHWEGVASGDASTTILIEQDAAVVAVFTPEPTSPFGCHGGVFPKGSLKEYLLIAIIMTGLLCATPRQKPTLVTWRKV